MSMSSEDNVKILDIDPLRLKKEESEWRNDKASYLQKIELLEILVKESKNREENLHKMNENLTSALNDFAHDTKKFSNNGLKEIQMTLDKNSQDFLQSKFKNNEVVKVLDNEVKKLKETIESLQQSKQEDCLNFEKEKGLMETKIRELEIERIRHENSIKSFQESQKNFGFSAYEIQTKMSNHNDIIDYLKRQHSVEIENLQYEYNQNFNELKSIYENEKTLIEEKMKSSQKLLKKYQRLDMTLRESSEFDKNLLEKENFELKKTIERINEEHMNEITKYLQKIQFLEKKVSFLQNKENFTVESGGSYKKCKNSGYSEMQLKEVSLNKGKESNSSRKDYAEKTHTIPFLHETSILNHQCERIHSSELENSKPENNCFDMFFKELSSRNDDKIKPKFFLKTSQPNLKSFTNFDNPLILEKDLEENSIQEIRISPRILKEDLKKQGMQFSSLENKINHLSKKKLLLDNKYSDEFNVSINENNRSVDMVVINANRDASLRKTPLQIKKNSTQKERSKSKSGFKSRTIATALLCEKCDETFQPQEFLEHMQYCHKNREDVNTSSRRHITEGSSNYFSTIFQNNDVSNLNEKYFSVQNIPENNEEFQFSNNNNSFLKRNNEPPLKKQSSELNNVLEGLNKEKNDIIFQLKHVEEKLQKTQIDNQIISEEKENLQVNLRNLLLELQNIKAQMAYSSEEKEQAENLLKKEIKILIKKLIKTKGKLVTQKKTSKIDCTNSSLVNLSGFINFYNQNKDNSTFGDKTLDTHNNADSSFLNQSIHQIYSNSLFSLANNPTTNSRNNSKSTIASAQQNTKMVIKTPTGNKEIFYTPNKNELEERNIRINIDKNFEKGDPKNFQLFKAKMNESTTTKPSKKMNRYNN